MNSDARDRYADHNKDREELTVKVGFSATEVASTGFSASSAWATPMRVAEDTKAEVKAALIRMMGYSRARAPTSWREGSREKTGKKINKQSIEPSKEG